MQADGAPRVLGVLGAGTMGAGIAQVAAAAGLRVLLCDVDRGQLEAATGRIAHFLRRAAEKGRMEPAAAEEAVARIDPTQRLEDLAAAGVVIEAVPENPELKRDLLGRLDAGCGSGTLLASNTSSLSITALGAATGRPDRVAGMHFFNPAPLMPLVEVVSGDATSEATASALEDLAGRLGKTPVRALDTPGFIVNRVARPFYGEALRLLGERLADAATVDRIVRACGFPMGPFQLMDLIGVDVNYAVTRSVYEAYFHEPRYRPHPIQRRLVESGALGRKAGRGFYRYPEEGEPVPAVGRAPRTGPAPGRTRGEDAREKRAGDGRTGGERAAATRSLVVAGDGPAAALLAERAREAGWRVVRRKDPEGAGAGPLAEAVDLAVEAAPVWGRRRAERVAVLDANLPDGVPLAVACVGGPLRDAVRAAASGRPLAGFNLWPSPVQETVTELIVPEDAGASPEGTAATEAALGAWGFEPAWIGDGAGGVAGRLVAMLVNEAAFAVAEGVATPGDIDTAMRLGTRYPQGPWQWRRQAGPLVEAVLEGLHAYYREERYRPAPLLG